MEGGYQIIVLVCGVPRAHYRLIVKNTKRHFFFLVGVGFEISGEFRRKQASEFIVLFIHA